MRRSILIAALVAVSAAAAVVATGSGAAAPTKQATHTTSAAVLASTIARARLATAKYATSLDAAKADGYQIITKMIPNMGYHFMNPKVKGFDVTRPAILVYLKRGPRWQLGALEWVFTEKPTTAPLPGARYGAFGAGCHYADGTFVPATAQYACPKTAPDSGAAFGFWHPNLITLHVWLWYPNPAGLYSGFNDLVHPYNGG
jgi:hypothetical protein